MAICIGILLGVPSVARFHSSLVLEPPCGGVLCRSVGASFSCIPLMLCRVFDLDRNGDS